MADHSEDRAIRAGEGKPDSYHPRGQRNCATADLAREARQMKALLLSEYRRLELRDVATPKPEAGEVLVRVAACGICGSDVHGYDGSSGRRIPPIVMGHEAAGPIAALGGDITNLAENERVTFDSTIS